MRAKLLILSCSLLVSLGVFAQSPGGVTTSLTCWVKANAGVTLNATNQVTQWNDFSGAGITGNFSTQGVAINKPTHVQPTIDPSAVNFNPYILFNKVVGTENSISSGNAVAGLDLFDANSNTVFQVFNLRDNTGTGVWLKWQWSVNPYGGPRYGNEVNNGGFPGQVRFDFKGPMLRTPENVLDKHSLITQAITPTSKFMKLGGKVSINAAPTGTFTPGTTTGRLTIGAEPYGDNYPTDIDYAELIIFKRELTAAEINKVESYLAIKYGMTLEQVAVNNNYVGSDGTVVWNSLNNQTYKNNITGVARDDGSALNQLQSKSINTGTFVTMYKGGGYAGVFPTANADNLNAFAADKNFLLFGDDNAALTLDACGDNGKIVRLRRVWKMITTGNDGLVTIAADKASLPAGITTMIIADDAAFTTNVAAVTLDDNGVELHGEYTFSGEKYFTFSATPLELNAIADTVCFGELGDIVLNPTGGYDPVTYSWNSNPVQNTATLTGVPHGTYTITVNQGGICQFTETHTIIGNETNMDVFANSIKASLCNSNSGSVTIYASGGTMPYSYSTDNINYSQNNTIKNLGYGNQTVYVKDNLGCLKQIIVTIPKDSIILEASVETYDAWCDAGGGAGRAIVNVYNGFAPYQYIWNNGIGLHPNIHEDLTKGQYQIAITDRMGCMGLTTFEIGEVPCCTYFVPNAFTPNEDGLNDIFKVETTVPMPSFHMTVFDRYGGTVFVSGNSDKGWDGKDYKTGVDADQGVYFYYIKFRCPLMNETEILKGEVTLIR